MRSEKHVAFERSYAARTFILSIWTQFACQIVIRQDVATNSRYDATVDFFWIRPGQNIIIVFTLRPVF